MRNIIKLLGIVLMGIFLILGQFFLYIGHIPSKEKNNIKIKPSMELFSQWFYRQRIYSMAKSKFIIIGFCFSLVVSSLLVNNHVNLKIKDIYKNSDNFIYDIRAYIDAAAFRSIANEIDDFAILYPWDNILYFHRFDENIPWFFSTGSFIEIIGDAQRFLKEPLSGTIAKNKEELPLISEYLQKYPWFAGNYISVESKESIRFENGFIMSYPLSKALNVKVGDIPNTFFIMEGNSIAIPITGITNIYGNSNRGVYAYSSSKGQAMNRKALFKNSKEDNLYECLIQLRDSKKAEEIKKYLQNIGKEGKVESVYTARDNPQEKVAKTTTKVHRILGILAIIGSGLTIVVLLYSKKADDELQYKKSFLYMENLGIEAAKFKKHIKEVNYIAMGIGILVGIILTLPLLNLVTQMVYTLMEYMSVI